MNKTKLMFLILRKNTKLLREYIYPTAYKDKRVFTDRRKMVIAAKHSLASMKPSCYNLIKTIATDIDRFEIIEPAKDFSTRRDEFHYVIPESNKVIGSCSMFHHFNNVEAYIPRVMLDTHLNIYFILYDDRTEVDDINLFTDDEHKWFTQVFSILAEAKEAEKELIQQRIEFEETQKIERKKEGILSKYN